MIRHPTDDALASASTVQSNEPRRITSATKPCGPCTMYRLELVVNPWQHEFLASSGFRSATWVSGARSQVQKDKTQLLHQICDYDAHSTQLEEWCQIRRLDVLDELLIAGRDKYPRRWSEK